MNVTLDAIRNNTDKEDKEAAELKKSRCLTSDCYSGRNVTATVDVQSFSVFLSVSWKQLSSIVKCDLGQRTNIVSPDCDVTAAHRMDGGVSGLSGQYKYK